MEQKHGQQQHTHHHILHNKTILGVGGSLLFLTVVTVWIAGVDLGALNFVVAMAVATVKAALVALFFMNLAYDRRENSVIFLTSILFLAIFIVLTSTDMFFRGDVYVKGPLVPEAKSKIAKPWIGTPELVARGKTVFAAQCVTCHGANGQGDGPAAAALNPRPRNFHSDQGWKNQRNVAGVFKTLREGIAGGSMASFSTLPADDRWALTHYVLSLGPKPAQASEADFAKANIPLTEGGGSEEKSLPIDVAMAKVAVADEKVPAEPVIIERPLEQLSAGARVYQTSCMSCHGSDGQGGHIRAHGTGPAQLVKVLPFTSRMSSLQSETEFSRIVIQGLPGTMMPGNGQLSSGELRDLYQHVRSLMR